MSQKNALLLHWLGQTYPFLDNPELLCRIKMCRRVAHKASTTAATVAGGVADTSLRVADGMVSRMGGSSYGQ